MNELSFYQYLLKTWLYQVSAGLQGLVVSRTRALPSRCSLWGGRPVPGQGGDLWETWKAFLLVQSCDSKDDLIKDHKGGSWGTLAADETILSCNSLLHSDTEELCLPRIQPALWGFQHCDNGLIFVLYLFVNYIFHHQLQTPKWCTWTRWPSPIASDQG